MFFHCWHNACCVTLKQNIQYYQETFSNRTGSLRTSVPFWGRDLDNTPEGHKEKLDIRGQEKTGFLFSESIAAFQKYEHNTLDM